MYSRRFDFTVGMRSCSDLAISNLSPCKDELCGSLKLVIEEWAERGFLQNRYLCNRNCFPS